MFHVLYPGDVIQLGRYPQAADGAVLPIDWRVLAVDADQHRALVLSEPVLDMQPFHDEACPVWWSHSALRNWLQTDFMRSAFSLEDQAQIVTPDAQEDPQGELLWSLFSMEDVTTSIADPIFLLSHADILQYFPGESQMFCNGASANATAWVMAHWDDDRPCYWLRSSTSQTSMAYIVSPVDSVGVSTIHPENCCGVRPALWIRME